MGSVPDSGAIVISFPSVYRIAWSDGEMTGLVDDFNTRHFWEAESALYVMQEKYPELMFWVTWRP